jgi:hypothetical protein
MIEKIVENKIENNVEKKGQRGKFWVFRFQEEGYSSLP